MTTTNLSEQSLEAKEGSHVYIPDLDSDYRSYHTGKILKTISNPNPGIEMTITNEINLPPFCTATDNPGPNSYMQIKYKSRDKFLEVFTFEKYVNSFIGNMVVRDVEFITQEIAKEAATVLGLPVEVLAFFELVGFKYGQNVTCEFKINAQQVAQLREQYPKKYQQYLDNQKQQANTSSPNKEVEENKAGQENKESKEQVQNTSVDSSAYSTYKPSDELKNEPSDKASNSLDNLNNELENASSDETLTISEKCPFHERLQGLSPQEVQEMLKAHSKDKQVTPNNTSSYSEEQDNCLSFDLDEEGWCPQAKVWGKAGDCPVIAMRHRVEDYRETNNGQRVANETRTNSRTSSKSNSRTSKYSQSEKSRMAMAKQAAKASGEDIEL